MTHDQSDHQRLDEATSRRLSRLAAMPVDVSGLSAKLRRAMDAQTPTPAPHVLRPRHAWRPVAAVAAALVVAGLIGWVVFTGGSNTAVAGLNDLAQLHQQVTRDIAPMMHATSVEQANQLLAEQYGAAKPLPNQMPGQMHACCLREFAGTQLSCVMLEYKGKLISVAVADADQLRSPKGQTVTRNGRTFTPHQANGVQMVMASEQGRWLCVMGDMDSNDLLDVASAIRF